MFDFYQLMDETLDDVLDRHLEEINPLNFLLGDDPDDGLDPLKRRRRRRRRHAFGAA